MFRKASEKPPAVEGGSLDSPRVTEAARSISEQQSTIKGRKDVAQMSPDAPCPCPYSVSLKEL